jgi:hypothetical protein
MQARRFRLGHEPSPAPFWRATDEDGSALLFDAGKTSALKTTMRGGRSSNSC